MRTLLVLAALVAVATPASGQDADPDSTYGEPLPEVVPDSLRPAPGPEPRTEPTGVPTDSSATSASAGTSSAVVASPRQEPAGATAATALAPGTAGHVIEIVVANGSPTRSLEGARVLPTGVPDWIELPDGPARLGALSPAGEAHVQFAFGVGRDAPVGAEGTLAFDVVDGRGAVLATRRFAVSVAAPAELALDLPRPNPSRGAVTVPFALPEAARVTVDVIDVLGRRVALLVDDDRPAGLGEATVDADALAPGTYVVRLVVEAEGRQEQRVRRLTVVR